MYFPLPLLPRGLFGFMDEQDKPRGLFSLFDREKDLASPADDGVDREAQGRWAADPVFQDARIEELRNLLTPSDPLPRDPETLAFLRQLQAVGSGLSGGSANATGYGPWAFPWPGGPSGPSAIAASTLMRSLQRPPWAVPSAGPGGQSQPGPYGWPQAGTYGRPQAGTLDSPQPGSFPGQIDVDDKVFHLPPELDEGEIEGGGGSRKVKGGGKYWPSTAANGPLDREPPHVKESFRSGSYYEYTPTEPVELYRSWGQDWKGNPNKQFGQYWVRQEPRGPGELMIDDAIKPSWNDFRNLTKVRIPPGEVPYVLEGPAARQGNLAGGGWQVYIPKDVDLSKWEVWTRPFR